MPAATSRRRRNWQIVLLNDRAEQSQAEEARVGEKGSRGLGEELRIGGF